MKFVIWGVGYRGKRFFEYIGPEIVDAFIDSDENKIGNTYNNKPIIGFETYLREYSNDFVIVSPAYTNEIDELLISKGIYNYSNLLELPSDIQMCGRLGFEKCYEKIIDYKEEKIIFYGLNAFSFMLYDLFKKRGVDNMAFLADSYSVSSKVKRLKEQYKELLIYENENAIKDDTAKILLTVRESIEKRFKRFDVIDAFSFADGLPDYYNNELLHLKNKYCNVSRCFIVATGPSLQKEDLVCLHNNGEFCFGVNGIINLESAWKPNVFVATDSYFVTTNYRKIEEYSCETKIVTDAADIPKWKEKDNIFSMHVNTTDCYFVEPSFSEDICQYVNAFATVTYACIQLAVYMGFREIYLLGVDCNYIKGSKNNHFLGDDKEDKLNHNENAMILAYKAAKRYADSHAIKIYNATRGGMLEVFERKEFERLFDNSGGERI